MGRLIRESEVIATTRLIHSTNKTPSSNTAPDTIHPHISAEHRRTQLRGGLRRMSADIRTTPGLGSYLLPSGSRVSDRALALAKWSGLPTAEITSAARGGVGRRRLHAHNGEPELVRKADSPFRSEKVVSSVCWRTGGY